MGFRTFFIRLVLLHKKWIANFVKLLGSHPQKTAKPFLRIVWQPVWSSLPDYLSNHIESIQKRALRIIFGVYHMNYQQALIRSRLETLHHRRDTACINFIKKVRSGKIEPPFSFISETNYIEVKHGYNLRSGSVKCWSGRKSIPNLPHDRLAPYQLG